jgi:hypothetical protein
LNPKIFRIWSEEEDHCIILSKIGVTNLLMVANVPFKAFYGARDWWLTSVILTIWEAEIWRVTV